MTCIKSIKSAVRFPVEGISYNISTIGVILDCAVIITEQLHPLLPPEIKLFLSEDIL